MRIVQLESLGVPEDTIQPYLDRLRAQGHTYTMYDATAPGELAARMTGADAVVIADMALPASAIDAAKDLRFVDVAFTGVDKVALDACRAHGVAVSNASGYATRSVAELCVGLMIDLLRDVPAAQEHARTGLTRAGLRANELGGRTVGIVGAGHIGRRVAALCHAFGCRTIAYDRHPVTDPAIDEQVGLDELFKRADLVSIHLGLYPDTRGLIDATRLKEMKPTAYLVNAARGPIVDQAALAGSLKDGTIAGAALDVFDTEPPLPEDAPILNAPHLIATPHIGFYTAESLALRARIAFDNLFAWLDGKQRNVIVP
ncbi:MAG: NAD(P)-dependent oxidoreductase [Bifidobacterium sp.]|nr:NAD(P)-dependent oxidoreductase [Bifidobacterium sp.]